MLGGGSSTSLLKVQLRQAWHGWPPLHGASILGFLTAWWSQDSKSANPSVHVPTKFLLVSCLVMSHWSNQVTLAESLCEEEYIGVWTQGSHFFGGH